MIYAVAQHKNRHSSELVEFKSVKEMKTCQADWPYMTYSRVTPEYARKWVKQGGIHNTALWINFDGKVVRA